MYDPSKKAGKVLKTVKLHDIPYDRVFTIHVLNATIMAEILLLFKEKIRTHLDLLSIPRLWGKNVKTFRWDQRLQIQNLFMAFKQVPRCR